jgi:DNA-binding XRE family transcriptional regulator
MTDTPKTAEQEIEELEYLNDVLAARLARVETANDELIPGEIVHRLSAGEPPLRVWREYRKLTAEGLAERAGVPVGTVAEIEGGRLEGPLRVFVALAGALGIDAEDLLPWPQDDAPP